MSFDGRLPRPTINQSSPQFLGLARKRMSLGGDVLEMIKNIPVFFFFLLVVLEFTEPQVSWNQMSINQEAISR